MGDSQAPSEQRRFPRLKESCKIRYRRVDAGEFPEHGTDALTVNISGGGICFEVKDKIEPGALLAIELTLAEFNSPVVSLGRTVWCEDQGGGRHELGMEFWWIGWGDDGAQQAMSGYIKNALEQ